VQKLTITFLLPLILISSSLTAFAQTGFIEEQTLTDKHRWSPRDTDLRILEVRVSTFVLEDVIAAYRYQDVTLLPLGAISDALDIALEFKNNTASGFVFKEENTFFLDTTRATITLKGKETSYDRELVHVLDDDIYVESGLLGKWLGVKLDVDLFTSRLHVRSDEPLPFEKRLKREKTIAKAMAQINKERVYYPRHYEPYEVADTPFIDQTLQYGIDRDSNGDETDHYSYTTYATADLFGLESRWYLTGNEGDELDEFRVTLGKKDPDAGLLGFMNAREYAFGHVSEPRLNLVNQPGSMEAGVYVSNFPLGQQSEFDRHRFRGDLLPGWEVELYHNNVLIGYQSTAVEGQYDFQDIPLYFGSNHFRLVFYGPQGQIREEEKYFELNQSLTQPGQHYYQFVSSEDEIKGTRTLARYDVGLSKNFSASVNAASIPLHVGTQTTQHNYAQAGLRGFWEAFFLTLDAIDDSEGGNAIDMGLQTQLGNTILRLNHTKLNSFFSEEFRPDAQEVTSRTQARLSTTIPPSFLPNIPISFEYTRTEFINGDIQDELRNRLSFSTRGVAVSNELIKQQTTNQPDIFTGALSLSSNISDIRLRGLVSYELDPRSEVTNVSLVADPGRIGNYRFSFGINYTLDPDLTEYSITANRISDHYNLSVGLRHNTNDETGFNIGLSFSLGREPRKPRWIASGRALASNGSVSARVFIDNNQDGLFDKEDEPLENVGFRVSNAYSSARTDENGIVFLTGLTAHNPVNLTIAQETLVDPLWNPAIDGMRIVPRPGHPIKLDFPIFLTGEIDGTVYLSKDGKEYGASKITVELVDKFNRVIKSTQTAFDGFYIISNIPTGEYRVRVSPEELQRLSVQVDKTETLEITPKNLFQNGFDFVLSQ